MPEIQTPRLKDQFIPEETVTSVEQAARYAGQAGAMVNNLALVDGTSPQKRESWEAEQAAWNKRTAARVSAAPLGAHKLIGYAQTVTNASFGSAEVTQADLQKEH